MRDKFMFSIKQIKINMIPASTRMAFILYFRDPVILLVKALTERTLKTEQKRSQI